VVLDLEHHLVASEVFNCEKARQKFAVGLQRVHAVSKLDSLESVSEQILALMREMGWQRVPTRLRRP
jgi:hypothetical protein